jgi:hypothetical protein
MGPQSRRIICPPPRSNNELRAPKTADIRGDRDAPAAGPQAPLMRNLSWEERGGLIMGSTSLYSDGSEHESCSGSLDPRDGSISSIASHRLAPRAKRKTGNSCHVPYSNRLKTIVRICRRFCKKNSEEFETRLAKCSLGMFEPQHPSTVQSCRAG